MKLRLPLKYEKLSDGTQTGKFRSGHATYVFLCRNGVPISFPFQSITPSEGGYVARFGRHEGRLDSEGRLVSGFSFSYNADTVHGIADEFLEAYLEAARKEICQAMKENDSQLSHYISNARIRARYERGMG